MSPWSALAPSLFWYGSQFARYFGTDLEVTKESIGMSRSATTLRYMSETCRLSVVAALGVDDEHMSLALYEDQEGPHVHAWSDRAAAIPARCA